MGGGRWSQRDLSAIRLATEQLVAGGEIDNNDPEYYMQREPAAHAAIVPVKGRSEVPSLIQLVYILYSARYRPRGAEAPRRGFAVLVRSPQVKTSEYGNT